jgi:ABC-type lipoprotein release transport system permease subunit
VSAMGRLLLVYRLGVRDLRHRPAQAVLLLLAIAAGAATLTLGLALHGTTDHPYARTRAATSGPDVVATVTTGGAGSGPATTGRPGQGPVQASPDALLALAHAPGVAARSGPFPVTWTLLHHGSTTGSAEVEGRDAGRDAVDRPALLRGGWIRPGGVVVEAGFASALGIGVGDRLTLAGRSFRVVGTAVSAAIPAYPNTCVTGCFLANAVSAHNPGLVWATRADATALAGPDGPDAYFLNLRLTDPGAATAFAARYDADTAPGTPHLLSWQQLRDGDARTLATVRQVLVTGSWLLALLAVASVAVLVGGRMAEQTRRVGLLKAVGGTAWLVSVVLLFEHAVVGLCAAAVGLAAGWLAAPLVDAPGAGLLGAAGAPSIGGGTLGAVLALALGVAAGATLVPAIRAARRSTVGALLDAARSPRRRDAVIRLSAHLPPALLLGVRLVVRRPGRLLLSTFSVAVTGSGLVVVMILHASAARWSFAPQVAQATDVISVMLVVLAAVNAAFIAWTTALEVRHSAALARALGATPRQVTAGLSAAQLVPALAGALLGIAGGAGIYLAAATNATTQLPPVPWLAAMVAVTLAATAALTAVPTHLGARRSVTDVLQAETT